jgi:hypothetical protein
VTLVDHETQGFHSFVILIKRTSMPINDNLLESITKRKLDKVAEKVGVTIESSSYVNGAYDWIINFTARDIKQAKKLCEGLNITYEGYIKELLLLEEIFPLKRCGVVNPEIDRLKEITAI